MKNAIVIRNAATLWAAFCFLPALAQTPAATPAAPLFAAIGERPAILYDGLSTKANKIFILSRQHPVEIIVKLDHWSKVRDAENTIGWMENSFMGDKRMVQVSVPGAEIRAAAGANAAIVFEAQRAVLLEVTGAATEGWLPVRHRDGQAGFVRLSQVWGA